MKKIRRYFFVALLAAGLWGCKDESNPYIDENAPAPAQVTGLTVQNTPGGAVLTYRIPKDPNLRYVMARYEIRPDVFREAKSSFYTDTLQLVGFGDTATHAVQVFSVGKNGKQSAPVSVEITPLEPPVHAVFRTLILEPTFGGINVTFQNPTQANLAISIIVDTTGSGTWAPVTTFYTASPAGNFAARGFDSTEKKFAVYIQDHWNNNSDTLYKSIAPFFEEAIPKNKFVILPLDGDSYKSLPPYKIENMWNGVVNTAEDYFKSSTDVFPQWFTVDMGEKVTFSRMKLFPITQYPFATDWISSFEIWGSNSTDTNWQTWTLLGHFELQRPSGLTGTQYTAEDLDWAKAGEDYTFPVGIPAVRYFRMKVLSNIAGGGKFYSNEEISFWGQINP